MNLNAILIAFLAGTASAAMTASVASLSIISIVLFYLAPLPLLIMGLSVGAHAAAIAGLSGAGVLMLVTGVRPGLLFIVSTAIAPVILSHFALMRRPAPEGAVMEGEVRAEGYEWYPEGRLLLWCAGIAGALVTASILAAGPDVESFRAVLRGNLDIMLSAEMQTLAGEQREQMESLVNLMIMALPMFTAVLGLLTLYVNLRMANLIVARSGKGLRPAAPFGSLRLPRKAGPAFIIALGASLLPGTFGVFASFFAAALLAAFVLLGLAVVHGLIENHRARGPLLFSLYFALGVLSWIVALPLAGLGLADQFTDIRARKMAMAANSNQPNDNEPSAKE